MMSLEALNERVKTDLSYLAYGGADWIRPLEHPEGHVYDVVIVGGGKADSERLSACCVNGYPTF